MPPQVSAPIYANYPSEKLTIGAGVAIFHIATERVIVCYHSRDKYWFLPKGRRNANEDTGRAAEREGFEESGYRNRLLPLPLRHRQPAPDEGHQPFVTEPIWTQLLPLSATSQYMLFWYAAETVPPDIERQYTDAPSDGDVRRIYRPPPQFPTDMTMEQRIAADMSGSDGSGTYYEPVWYPETGVNEEEKLYRSYLMPVSEAVSKLKGSVMADVIRRAADAIKLRMEMEGESGNG